MIATFSVGRLLEAPLAILVPWTTRSRHFEPPVTLLDGPLLSVHLVCEPTDRFDRSHEAFDGACTPPVRDQALGVVKIPPPFELWLMESIHVLQSNLVVFLSRAGCSNIG